MLDIPIIFEDKDILIVNKPPYLVVNEATTVGEEQTVQQWLRQYLQQTDITSEWPAIVPQNFSAEFGTPEAIFEQRAGIVHRLDKETSGVLVLAKNPGSLVNLLSQFKERTVQKEYLCLVHGKFNVSQDIIDVPIARSPRDRKIFDVAVEGRSAVTEYQVQAFYPHFSELKWLELFKNHILQNVNYHYEGNHKNYFKIYQGFSLVKCLPKTGRTHQIRVHMAHLQHPLVGDSTYAGVKRNKADSLWCPRQFLHAQKITIAHPRTREEMTFEAELPEDLQLALLLVSASA